MDGINFAHILFFLLFFNLRCRVRQKKIEKIKLNFDEILEKFILALYIMKLFSVDMYRINISECNIQYFHATNFTILHNNIDLIKTFFHVLY